ncbi:hypothetical protein ACFL3T_05375 [Patescibacteria group bacterium]
MEGYKESSKVINQTEGKIATAEKQLKNTNTALQNASAERFRIRNRIEMKAETWMSRSDNMRRFAKVVQYGGMGSGLIYFLSDYKYGAGKQWDTVKKGVGTVTGAAGFVGHQLFFANHGGKDSIDQYIEKKIHALEQKNKMAGIIDQAKKEGRSELDVLAENSNTKGAQEYIKSNGLAGKMAALRAKVSGATRREIATGDSVKKAGEKLAG